jgi:hypothetical protein
VKLNLWFDVNISVGSITATLWKHSIWSFLDLNTIVILGSPPFTHVFYGSNVKCPSQSPPTLMNRLGPLAGGTGRCCQPLRGEISWKVLWSKGYCGRSVSFFSTLVQNDCSLLYDTPAIHNPHQRPNLWSQGLQHFLHARGILGKSYFKRCSQLCSLMHTGDV